MFLFPLLTSLLLHTLACETGAGKFVPAITVNKQISSKKEGKQLVNKFVELISASNA